MKIIEKTLEYLTVIFLILLVITVTLQIGSRMINNPLQWTEELSRHALVYMTFLGAALAFYKGHGMKITSFTEKFPPMLRKTNDIFIDSLVLLSSIILCYLGIKLGLLLLDSPTPSMRLSKGLLTFVLPLGFSLIVIKAVKSLFTTLRKAG
ncbi:TRAP transporter small permease [Oceanobacillus indicireducens]|uniref:Tripartite ATP-independent periplasmic transporters DctQ component domain-containing protein n=1 Tax=Oceanobacillus indicireducens TaxID=1004261 RepID=A0A917XYL6_9BACI|nr:TRAP transporter small permease [Oceanobacillus indicireducens]GGN59649.1 hypothetical protein GCM10007971_23010 [Oceanobacillus indicireducens]